MVDDAGFMSLFSGQSPDLISLAEDEARMLGSDVVEPEHLLLAFARRGRVRELLSDQSVGVAAVHAAVVGVAGVRDELVLGRLPRSRTSERVLRRAVEIAFDRGDRRPHDEHVLLALAEEERIRSILDELGLDDVRELVDEHYPPRDPPLSRQQATAELVQAALGERRREAHVPVPAFERFTIEARRSVRAAAETAALLEHRHVDPFHVLIGGLQVPDSLAARVLSPLWEQGELGSIGEAIDLAARIGPHPFHQATGIFSDVARRVVAEDALALAYRLGHEQISSGHLLLATLDSRDRTTEAMTRPHTQRLARTLMRSLPGAEQRSGDEDLAWIQFDILIRILVDGFRRILPPGWRVMGSARSDIHLNVPDSRSESDFQIRPGWIVAEGGTARHRLQHVTCWMLERLQAAVTQTTGRPWPETPDGATPRVHAQLIDDRYNPKLRLGYGDPEAPIATATGRDINLNMVVNTL